MDSLPKEILISIFLYLERKSICKVYRLNKRILQIFGSENLWKTLVLNTVKSHEQKSFEERIVRQQVSWKNVFRDLRKFPKEKLKNPDPSWMLKKH
jgi:hypothetical protein